MNEGHDNPVLLALEIDDNSYEIRKIEIWFNGVVGWADRVSHSESTALGYAQVPSVEEINKDKQFKAVQIIKEDFERFWTMKNEDVQ
jgi:hypothetical protein